MKAPNIETFTLSPTRLAVGLGWDPHIDPKKVSDLDISALLLDASGKLLSPRHIVFYHNKRSLDESVLHLGDNRSGEGKCDDEIILLNLDSMEKEVERVALVVSIYGQSTDPLRIHYFNPVRRAFVRLFDYRSNEEIVRLDINEQYDTHNGLIFGYLFRTEEGWLFELAGQGTNKGFEGLLSMFA